MDGTSEAQDYEAMDFSATDSLFAERALQLNPSPRRVVDVGSGNARITAAIAAKSPADAVIYAVDMSTSMLAFAQRRLPPEGSLCLVADAKRLPFPDGTVDLVVTNSLVHHIPDPRSLFQEIARVVAPGGAILIRDLFRPESVAQMEALIAIYAAGCSELQTSLLRDSFCAALTVAEARQQLDECGLADLTVYQASDRHWSAERSA